MGEMYNDPQHEKIWDWITSYAALRSDWQTSSNQFSLIGYKIMQSTKIVVDVIINPRRVLPLSTSISHSTYCRGTLGNVQVLCQLISSILINLIYALGPNSHPAPPPPSISVSETPHPKYADVIFEHSLSLNYQKRHEGLLFKFPGKFQVQS